MTAADQPTTTNPVLAAIQQARLTTRERQVLERALAGKRNREIAAELGISPRTVEVFKGRMREKLRALGLVDLINALALTRPR